MIITSIVLHFSLIHVTMWKLLPMFKVPSKRGRKKGSRNRGPSKAELLAKAKELEKMKKKESNTNGKLVYFVIISYIVK